MTPMQKQLSRLLPALVLLATTARADDETALDPVLVTGSRTEKPSLRVPTAASIIEARSIGEGQLRVNASEALAQVPGLTVANRHNYAQDLQIVSRGFGARAAFGVRGLRLLTDGIPATMPDGQGQAATFNLDLAQRIEVLRGPYSVVYGNHAGGVVQLFTREPEPGGGAEIRALAGAHDTWKLDANAEGRLGSLTYLIDGSRFSTAGFRPHGGATRDQGMIKLGTTVGDDGKLTLLFNYLDQDGTDDPLGLTWTNYQRDPRSVEAPALSFNTRKSLDHGQLGAHYQDRFAGGQLNLVGYFGERRVLQFQSIPPSAQTASRSSGGVITFARGFGGLDTRWTRDLALGPGQLTATLGLDLARSRDDRQGYENFSGTTLGVLGRLRRNEIDTVTAIDPYLQLEWARGLWEITGGLRRNTVKFKVADRYLANGNDSGAVDYRQTTGMLGTSFELAQQTRLYFAAARGFETPTLNEIFYSGNGGGFNFELAPARSTHFEIGLKTQAVAGLRAEVAAYEVRTREELVVDTASGGRTSYRNATRTLRRGVEAALHAKLPGGLGAKLALSAVHASYRDAYTTSGGGLVAAGNRLPAVPAWQGFAELAWRDAAHGHFAALELQGRSRLQVEDTNSAQAAPGYVSLNLRLGTEWRRGTWVVSPFLRVDNLLDRPYIASVVVGDANRRYYEPAAGLSVFAGIALRLR